MKSNKQMKTFKDLTFKEHHLDSKGKKAEMYFPNGYGISVVRFKIGMLASCTSSDNTDWEVAVLKENEIYYTSEITDDVIGFQSNKEVTEIMKKIQKLNN